MIIHTVSQGETFHSISEQYGVPESRIVTENALDPVHKLIEGQTLLISKPEKTWTVRGGDTLQSIAEHNGISILTLLQNNPQINYTRLIPSQTLNIAYAKKEREISVSAYTAAASFSQVEKYLPYITNLHIQNSSYIQNGEVSLLENAAPLVSMAKQFHALPILVVECTDEYGRWSSRKTREIFDSPILTERFLWSTISTAEKNGFSGVEIHLFASDAAERQKRTEALIALQGLCNEKGLSLSLPILPSAFDDADIELGGLLPLWNCFGADLCKIETMLSDSILYREKLLPGIPTFGIEYLKSGKTVIRNAEIMQYIRQHSGRITFDDNTQAPVAHFSAGPNRQFRFEDARSYAAKLALVDRYDLGGIYVMSLAYDAPVLWHMLNQKYSIIKRG